MSVRHIIAHFLICFLIGNSDFLACNAPTADRAKKLWTNEDKSELINGLDNSRDSLMKILQPLDDQQWHYKKDDETWSVAEITEHLGLQQDMHYREVYVLSKTPPFHEFVEAAKSGEIQIKGYATDTTKGNATWNVTPRGRWCSKEDALNQFNETREYFIEFVKNTNADLRKHFTFRNLPDKNDYRNVRDLHQIVLTTVTHTERHTEQIRKILEDPAFPD